MSEGTKKNVEVFLSTFSFLGERSIIQINPISYLYQGSRGASLNPVIEKSLHFTVSNENSYREI